MDRYASLRPMCSREMPLFDEILANRPEYAMDIGCNVGGVIETIAGRCGYIDAFEPVPDCYEKAKQKESIYPNVHVHKFAISDTVDVIFDVNVFNAWSVLPNDTDIGLIAGPGTGRPLQYPEEKPFSITTITLDKWVDHFKRRPDFIKLDVDGYEFRVLKGGGKTLRSKPCPIFFEFSFLPKLLGDSVEEMADFIYSLGYRAWSGDGTFVAQDAKEFLKYFPHDTSYDVMLVHSSQR